jgi:23S rRNA (pseudouridine1915-N3)-methyltransferase
MVINLIAVGKRMPSWVEEGFNEYAKRLPPPFKLKLIEISLKKRGEGDVSRQLKQEGEDMLAAIPPASYTIALDVKGEQWNTSQLSCHLQNWREREESVSLLVGGPEGLADSCLAHSRLKWSLSPLTFPHPLVRIIVAEQLYRAWSILSHHPYHRN